MEKTKKQMRRNEALQNGPGEDHDRDPKIGQSKGAFATGEDPELIDGENTVEGDIENDSTYGGGVDPRQLGRTNK